MGTPFADRKKPTTKRVGPPCNSENAPGGCGRPLPVSNVPKSEEALAKLEARAARDQARLLKARGITVKALPTPEEKAAAEAAKAKAKELA